MAVDASPVSGDTGSAGPDDAAGDDDPSVDATRRLVRGGWILAGLAVLTVLLGVAIPLAPVIADDPVVTWPKAGAPVY